MISAAGVMTFRQGVGLIGIGGTVFTLSSGAYFPLSVLPAWIKPLARLNPFTVAVRAMREALLADAGWPEVWPAIVRLFPMTALSLAAGIVAFRLAFRRERRRGTLGLY